MEILDSIKNKLNAIQQQKEQLTAELRKDFAPMLKPLFEKHPIVKSIGWEQYTPYFNDGEECVFSTNFDYSLSINGFDDYGDQRYEEEGIKEQVEFKESPELQNAHKDFEEILTSIPDDFYKDLFGDHVQVIVKSDGSIVTEEYEHD